jgi:hypothetical protein
VATAELPGGALALIDGQPLPDPKDCEHRTVFTQTIVGLVEKDGRVIGWEILLKLRCGACGVPFDFDPSTARRPTSVPHGVVCQASPVPE